MKTELNTNNLLNNVASAKVVDRAHLATQNNQKQMPTDHVDVKNLRVDLGNMEVCFDLGKVVVLNKATKTETEIELHNLPQVIRDMKDKNMLSSDSLHALVKHNNLKIAVLSDGSLKLYAEAKLLGGMFGNNSSYSPFNNLPNFVPNNSSSFNQPELSSTPRILFGIGSAALEWNKVANGNPAETAFTRAYFNEQNSSVSTSTTSSNTKVDRLCQGYNAGYSGNAVAYGFNALFSSAGSRR